MFFPIDILNSLDISNSYYSQAIEQQDSPDVRKKIQCVQTDQKPYWLQPSYLQLQMPQSWRDNTGTYKSSSHDQFHSLFWLSFQSFQSSTPLSLVRLGETAMARLLATGPRHSVDNARYLSTTYTVYISIPCRDYYSTSLTSVV